MGLANLFRNVLSVHLLALQQLANESPVLLANESHVLAHALADLLTMFGCSSHERICARCTHVHVLCVSQACMCHERV